MNSGENLFPVETYWQYLEVTYPTFKLALSPQFAADINQTHWDEPQSSMDLNNIAVMTLIELETIEDLSLKSLYLDSVIEGLNQGLEVDANPLCAAHLALIYVMLGEFRQAIDLAFPVLMQTFHSLSVAEKTPKGLIYFPIKLNTFAVDYTKKLEAILEATNHQTQGLLFLAEILCQAHFVFYNTSSLRFLQLVNKVIPHSVVNHFHLGLACIYNQQWEGLYYLHLAQRLDPNSESIIQALSLVYQQLGHTQLSQIWQTIGNNYYHQTAQQMGWQWSQLPPDHPFTYVVFDHDVLLAVESSLRSIVTVVLLGQQDWFETEIDFWRTQIQAGMTVIDVGANVGVYTFSAAKRVGKNGKVIAIEPFHNCVKKLEETCKLNQFHQVKIKAGAASNENKKDFLSLHNTSETNTIVSNTPNSNQTENVVEINCFTLDSLIEEENLTAVDWLKIDAEGHEEQVLAGCERLLTEFYPCIIYENIADAQGNSNVSVAQYLWSQNYQLFRYCPYFQGLIPIDSVEGLQGSLNIIALPPLSEQGSRPLPSRILA